MTKTKKKRVISKRLRADDEEIPSAEDEAVTSSDPGHIRFEPEVVTVTSSEEDEDIVLQSPQVTSRSQAKKRKQRGESDEPVTVSSDEENVGVPVVWKGKGREKVQNTAELPPSKVPKRQHSVWVGNLSFKTTPASLRSFFEGVGEITRIHMPMKMAHGGPDGKPRKENRGSVLTYLSDCVVIPNNILFGNSFAYVDFATPDAKTIAITMSENPLEGRRLLIKDGTYS